MRRPSWWCSPSGRRGRRRRGGRTRSHTRPREPSPASEPVVACAGGILIARRAPRTFLIADPDLLNNQGLGRAGNAEAVYQLLVQNVATTGLVFDEAIHGFDRVPGLLAESLRFPLVLGVLQSLLLLGAVLWAGMGRFGKPL